MVCPEKEKIDVWLPKCWRKDGGEAVCISEAMRNTRSVLSRWIKRLTRRRACSCTQRRINLMVALQPGMDRLSHELSAQRDRQVRLQSVETDIALDLPPSIQLPDGEELPYGSATRLHIRHPDQESEIYQKCVRPPPNRTVFDGESPPPYRSSSAGVLPSDWSSSSSSSSSSSGSAGAGAGASAGLLRCHSMGASQSVKRPADNILGRTVRCLSGKRHEEPARPPAVVVPHPHPQPQPPPRCRHRRLSAFSDTASTLASLPTVHCATQSKAHRPAV